MGWRIDRIIHAEIWATDTISADLPPMVEFKAKADEIIKSRWGIEVEHFRANLTFEQGFYLRNAKTNALYGYPNRICNWCNSRLKIEAINRANKSVPKDAVNYVGIALDELPRLERLWKKKNVVSPLEAVGWTESDAMKWCIENDLRSPLYDHSNRGGCWFCYNATIEELRYLRKAYPQLWQMLLKWDADADARAKVGMKPNVFKARNGCDKVGSRVKDFDRRFYLEDIGAVPRGGKWRWSYLNDIPEWQMSLDDLT